MGLAIHKFNTIILLLAALTPVMARADAPQADLQFKGLYELSFSGIPLGKMGIETQQDKGNYTIVSDVTTTGLVNAFVRHSSHTKARKNLDIVDYESHYQTRKKPRHVQMQWTAGRLSKELAEPADSPQKRPPVDAMLKDKAVDPLSLALKMRNELHNILLSANASPKDISGTSFDIDAYDGRRLTRVHFTVIGRIKIRLKGETVPVIELTSSRTQIAGFTEQEKSDFNPKESPAHFYFSDDARLIPLRATVNNWLGTASATLVKECGAQESCLLGIAE